MQYSGLSCCLGCRYPLSELSLQLLLHHGPAGCLLMSPGRQWMVSGTWAPATYARWMRSGLLACLRVNQLMGMLARSPSAFHVDENKDFCFRGSVLEVLPFLCP